MIKLDITYNPEEAVEYFNILEKTYSHYKWKIDEDFLKLHEGQIGDYLDNLYGYSLRSPLDDLSVPYLPHNTALSAANPVWRDTELVFGFAKKIKDFFPGIRMMTVLGHPPTVGFGLHTDPADYFTIQIPIKTNPDAFFICGEKHNFKVGQVYLIETGIEEHGTRNEGTTDRIHFVIKCNIADLEKVKQLSGNI